jgi:uncharacterized membrane protein
MGKGRLEAFSDGVLAVIITIMVLELKVPQGDDLAALGPMLHGLLSYVLSFVYVGIYWNNHHHLLHAARRVNGRILWANLHLLFWLSIVPVVTAWIGEHPSSVTPAALYGVLLFLAAIAFLILERAIIAANPDTVLREALGVDAKGLVSQALYVLGIAAAFFRPWLAELLYATVAVIWIIPDPRVERRIGSAAEGSEPVEARSSEAHRR